MNVTEERLALWARPLSETEEDKCKNARECITEVMRDRFGNDVRVFLQGSYANRTNVRQDSDIDIVVLHTGYFFPDLTFLQQHEKDAYWSSFESSTYKFEDFRREVHESLSSAFSGMVDPKEKCLKVRGTSSRMNADVVPSFEHHRLSSPSLLQSKGIEFRTLSGTRIESFPEQHYDNGVEKNDATGRTYKQIVRILKNVRNILVEQGKINEKTMPSYFVECLVWNVPNSYFNGTTFRSVAREVTAKIWNDMQDAARAQEYLEVSQHHWLFKGQKRTPEEAAEFTRQAWNYLAP